MFGGDPDGAEEGRVRVQAPGASIDKGRAPLCRGPSSLTWAPQAFHLLSTPEAPSSASLHVCEPRTQLPESPSFVPHAAAASPPTGVTAAAVLGHRSSFVPSCFIVVKCTSELYTYKG